MIYTVTFNPALDYILSVSEFRTGYVNRTDSEQILAGGKGINVSIVLNNLGISNTALGFIGGFTGDRISQILETSGCSTDFIRAERGMSRINIKIKSEQETEINGSGPTIGKENIKELYKKLDKVMDGDYLVLAGSIPKTLDDNIYMDIMEYMKNRKINIIVDATKELLVNSLKYKPFLVKPNKQELGDIFGTRIETEEQLLENGLRLKHMGARNVLVSLAGDGALLITEDMQIFRGPSPKGKLINSVGAGDSMVAGFIAGYIKNQKYEEAYKLGVASGSASAFSENLATKQEIQELFDNIKYSHQSLSD